MRTLMLPLVVLMALAMASVHAADAGESDSGASDTGGSDVGGGGGESPGSESSSEGAAEGTDASASTDAAASTDATADINSQMEAAINNGDGLMGRSEADVTANQEAAAQGISGVDPNSTVGGLESAASVNDAVNAAINNGMGLGMSPGAATASQKSAAASLNGVDPQKSASNPTTNANVNAAMNAAAKTSNQGFAEAAAKAAADAKSKALRDAAISAAAAKNPKAAISTAQKGLQDVGKLTGTKNKEGGEAGYCIGKHHTKVPDPVDEFDPKTGKPKTACVKNDDGEWVLDYGQFDKKKNKDSE